MISEEATIPCEARFHLQREGWVVIPNLLNEELLEMLLDETAALEQLACSFIRDTLVKGVFFEVQSASGRKGETAIYPGALRKITFPSKGQPTFKSLRTHPRIISALKQCGLSQPKCHVDQINLKLPRLGTGFPFHQDARFVIDKTRARIERLGGLNLVIALDKADASNGGLEVLGRTHLEGLKEFAYDTSTTNEGVFDETYRTIISLNPGDALFFHPHLAHGSDTNRSDKLRRLVAMWFVGS